MKNQKENKNPAKTSGNKNLIGLFLSVFLAGFLLSGSVSASTIFEDDFNSCPLGDLDGVCSFSGGVGSVFQNTFSYSGVAIKTDSSNGFSRLGSSIPAGQITARIYIPVQGAYDHYSFQVKDSATEWGGSINFASDGYAYATIFEDGQYLIGSWSFDDWINLKIEWTADDLFRYSYGATTTEWLTANNPGALKYDRISVDPSGIAYLDDISEEFSTGGAVASRLFTLPAGFIASSSSRLNDMINDSSPVLKLLVGVWIGCWIIEWLISRVEKQEKLSRKK